METKISTSFPNTMRSEPQITAIRQALRGATDIRQVYLDKLDSDRFVVEVTIERIGKGKWSQQFFSHQWQPEYIRRAIETIMEY